MRTPFTFLFALGLLAVGGCETAKVTHATGQSTARKNGPVVVKEFDASQAVFKGENSQINVLANADRQRISKIIAASVIEHLTKNGYDARPYSTAAPVDALVIDGVVTTVDKGSFNKRFLIGMGSGAAAITANVKLYNAGSPANAIANLDVTGTSKAFTGGMYSNDDWIGIYSAGLGTKSPIM